MVRVVEGESTVPSECTPLGICDIELPPFLPKGSPVELTYHYNENQVLEVVVEAYGRTSRVAIARNTGLSENDMNKAQVGIASMWFEGNPCNMHLLDLAAEVKKGV